MRYLTDKRTNPYLAIPAAAFLIFCVMVCLSGPAEKGGEAPERPAPILTAGESPLPRTAPSEAPPTELPRANKLELLNRSNYAPDLYDYRERELYFTMPQSGPAVLIIHTHGTEAYSPADGLSYEPSDIDRTLDMSRSVMRVGDEVERVLSSHGIEVVHSRAVNDYPRYAGSYDRSLADAREYLEKYPSLRVILDIHRDAGSSNENKLRTAREAGGVTAAGVEIVVGTDGGGLRHDNWEQNLAFAVRLYDAAEGMYPGLMRPICLRAARFNQHLTPGALLIEIGANGDTLTEAVAAARMLAEALALLLG